MNDVLGHQDTLNSCTVECDRLTNNSGGLECEKEKSLG